MLPRVADMRQELDGNYAPFGRVVEGMELLDRVLKTEVRETGGGSGQGWVRQDGLEDGLVSRIGMVVKS